MAKSKDAAAKEIASQKTNKELEKIVLTNDIIAIKRFTAAQILAYKGAGNGNLFILAAQKSNLNLIQAIIAIVKSAATAIVVKSFLQKLDHHGHGAFWYVIGRNAYGIFRYLLTEETILSENDFIQSVNNEQFIKFFNSPECFLAIVTAKHTSTFIYILRHIKGISKEKQRPFLDTVDEKGRNALMIAANNKHAQMVSRLITLDFNLEARDKLGQRVLLYFLKQAKIAEVNIILPKIKKLDSLEAKCLNILRNRLLRSTKVSKIFIGNALTHSLENFSQTGRIPKTLEKEVLSPNRSFSSERERQLLRQVGTQLYFSFDKKLSMLAKAKSSTLKNELVELQVMHMDFLGKQHLFIAANEYSMTRQFPTFVKTNAELTTILTTDHNPADKEGKRRSSRYAKKLKSRVFNKNSIFYEGEHPDNVHALQVAEVIQKGKVQSLRLRYSGGELSEPTKKAIEEAVVNQDAGGIYIVVIENHPHDTRHAEAFLTDIAQFAQSLKPTDKLYTCIGGKKRPCMSCSGHMQGIIDQFSNHPGRLWINTIENQREAEASRTVNVILTKPSYITYSKESGEHRDYDSGSDSEADEVKKSAETGKAILHQHNNTPKKKLLSPPVTVKIKNTAA